MNYAPKMQKKKKKKSKNSCKLGKAVLEELSDCEVSNNCKKGKGELFS